MKTSSKTIRPYLTKDGSVVRELMHPEKHGCRNLSFAEAEIEKGRSTVLHRHRGSEEIYHVTAGAGLMTLGSEQFPIYPGDTICILPGVPHWVMNTGKESLRILCCCAPPYAHDDTEIL